MAWEGWWEYNSSQIINSTQTEAYAANSEWFRAVYKNSDLPLIIADPAYTTPALDPAPWYDPDVAASAGFFGVYPLSITGVEDSTRQSAAVENIGDGGTPGSLRHGMKTIVFSVLLVGASDAAVEYGMKYLRNVLLGPCSDRLNMPCQGAGLRYFASTPVFDPTLTPDNNMAAQCRIARQVVVNQGPTVLSKNRFQSCGGAVWNVQFTAVCGQPWEYTTPVAVASQVMDPDNPPVLASGVTVDETGHAFTEVACPVAVYQPVFDPECPAIIPPPATPGVAVGCFTLPAGWTRRNITIPETLIPTWFDLVPTFTFAVGSTDVRYLRVRFFSIDDDPDATPCAFNGDMVISFLPANKVMTVDATDRSVVVYDPTTGSRRRADSLIFSSDGSPIKWPSLSCGIGYICVIDAPVGETLPIIALELTSRAA